MERCDKNMYWVVYDKSTGCVVVNSARKDYNQVLSIKGELDGNHFASTLDIMLVDMIKVR